MLILWPWEQLQILFHWQMRTGSLPVIGLERLLKKQNIGLNALIKIAGFANKELNSADIVFGIAPRINAAGRMGSAMRAVELMVPWMMKKVKNWPKSLNERIL